MLFFCIFEFEVPKANPKKTISASDIISDDKTILEMSMR